MEDSNCPASLFSSEYSLFKHVNLSRGFMDSGHDPLYAFVSEGETKTKARIAIINKEIFSFKLLVILYVSR
jgi:hypothetical protein